MTAMTVEAAFPCGRPKVLEIDGPVALVSFGNIPLFVETTAAEISLRPVAPVFAADGHKISIGGKSIGKTAIIACFDIPLGPHGRPIPAPLTAAGLEDFLLDAIDQAVGVHADATRNILHLLARVASIHTGSPEVAITSFPAGLCFYFPGIEEDFMLRDVCADLGARIARLRSCTPGGHLHHPGNFKHDFHARRDSSGHEGLAAMDDCHTAIRAAGLDAPSIIEALIAETNLLNGRLSA